MIWLLFACSDPKPVAQKTCEALPTASPDPVGLELLEPLLTEDEFAAYESAEPTLGMQEHGDKLAELRAQTSCTVDDVQSAGSGAWAIKLTQTRPAVEPDGSLGAPVETKLEWQATKKDTVRMDIGLRRAASMRKSVKEALESGDIKRVASTWRALSTAFPDPFAFVDIEAAEAYEARAELAGKLEAAFDRVEDGQVVAKVENPTDVALSAAIVSFTFKVGDEVKAKVPVKTEGIAAGATIEVRTEIPEAIDGTVVVSVDEVAL